MRPETRTPSRKAMHNKNKTPRYLSAVPNRLDNGVCWPQWEPPVGSLEDPCHLPLVCGPAKHTRPGKGEQGTPEKLGTDRWNQQARKLAGLAAQPCLLRLHLLLGGSFV